MSEVLLVEHELLKRDAAPGLTTLGGMCVVQICLILNRLCHSGVLFGLVLAALTCKAACFFLGRMLTIWATEKHSLDNGVWLGFVARQGIMYPKLALPESPATILDCVMLGIKPWPRAW